MRSRTRKGGVKNVYLSEYVFQALGAKDPLKLQTLKYQNSRIRNRNQNRNNPRCRRRYNTTTTNTTTTTKNNNGDPTPNNNDRTLLPQRYDNNDEEDAYLQEGLRLSLAEHQGRQVQAAAAISTSRNTTTDDSTRSTKQDPIDIDSGDDDGHCAAGGYCSNTALASVYTCHLI